MTQLPIRLNTKLLGSLSTVLYMPVSDIINSTGIANSTWYHIMERPGEIAIKYLLQLANGLHIPARRFFSDSRTDLIGRREDYVIASYQHCYYDSDALQVHINSSPAATWQRAATAIGMSRSRLRDSLLAVTRTPVHRFLTVCNIFEIDPFSVLIDPNPQPQRKGSRSVAPPSPATSTQGKSAARESTGADEALQAKIESLTAAYQDLLAKYDALLTAHNTLARRVNVNIEHINNGYIGIAAEADTPPYGEKS